MSAYLKESKLLRVVFLFLLVFTLKFALEKAFNSETHAAGFTDASIRLARMTASTSASSTNPILVVVTPTTASAESALKITWTSFGVNSTNTNHTLTTASIPSTYQGLTLTAWPGIGATASAVSGSDVYYASSDLSTGSSYAFFITGGLSNPGSANAYTVTMLTRDVNTNQIDTQNIAVRIITSDQITISATVPPIFTFSLGATSDSFASNLSSTTVVSTTGVSVTITTNAQGGWGAYVRSANAALSSSTSGGSIATAGTINGSPSTLVNGTAGYVLDVDLTTDSGTGTGSVSIAGEYNGASTAAGGTLSSTELQEIATASGTTDGDVITLIARAAISAVTPAATDYTDTLTVVGAGNF